MRLLEIIVMLIFVILVLLFRLEFFFFLFFLLPIEILSFVGEMLKDVAIDVLLGEEVLWVAVFQFVLMEGCDLDLVGVFSLLLLVWVHFLLKLYPY